MWGWGVVVLCVPLFACCSYLLIIPPPPLPPSISLPLQILVVVSHSQDFLNGVCSNMMVMQNRKLRYWGGNYDTYLKTRAEQDSAQLKEFKKQQVRGWGGRWPGGRDRSQSHCLHVRRKLLCVYPNPFPLSLFPSSGVYPRNQAVHLVVRHVRQLGAAGQVAPEDPGQDGGGGPRAGALL